MDNKLNRILGRQKTKDNDKDEVISILPTLST